MMIGSFLLFSPKPVSAANFALPSLDKPKCGERRIPAFRGERQPIRSRHWDIRTQAVTHPSDLPHCFPHLEMPGGGA